MSGWRQIDNNEVEGMVQFLESRHFMQSSDYRWGAFLGGRCDSPYRVKVPALAGRRAIVTHRELDVCLWLPNSPYMLGHMTSLTRSRLLVRNGGDASGGFMVIHFHDRCLQDRPVSRNYLIDIITGDDCEWFGEILVVKIGEKDTVEDMMSDDFMRMPAVLRMFIEQYRAGYGSTTQ